MSGEEEVTLSELITQNLESNGSFSKIRAMLRANMFLVLDEDKKLSQQEPLKNKAVESWLELPEGRMMFALVREFLEFFKMDFTILVYEPESLCHKYEGRQKIIEDLGLSSIDSASPILLQLVKIAQNKSKTLKINLNLKDDQSEHFNNSELNGDSKKEEIHFEKVEMNATYTTSKEPENDDTFNGTSSIEEEIVSNGEKESSEMSMKAPNKIKSVPKQLKSSLYHKDFSEKSDFGLEIKDDYEEDFMSGSEVEFSLSKVDCPKPLLEELLDYDTKSSDTHTPFTLSSKSLQLNQKRNLKNAQANKDLDNGSSETESKAQEHVPST